ncbi:response regulator [Pseudonocardia pini]|uniref:response regulator n=1 Tax=Pseudonocardia pini TaxID=2758030 RepID=UPI0015EFE77A|nr:response regulator transcription factor [Pseudonocardia pini]
MPIRVLLADDQAVVRAGLRVVLDAEADISVVGEAADGAEAARRADELRPDVVLMDVQMPGCDGIEGLRRIVGRQLGVRVLMVTTFDLDRYVFDALRAGASGFVLKDIEPDELCAAVRTVHAGHSLLAPEVTGRLIEAFVRSDAPPTQAPPTQAPPTAAPVSLTGRERDVVGLVARGMSNAEIAAALVVAESTVKTHVSSLLLKLGLRDRVQLVVHAFETGLTGRAPGA